METDVLVIGGGASGVSAGLQAGRLGVKTIIVEPTTWLGGMVTAAGVSAFDGNHDLPSGIFGEFRNKLYQVYGNPENVSTGWVSMTLFEPHVGDSIFKKLVASVPALQVLYSHQFVKVLRNGNTVMGAVFTNKQNNQVVTIHAKQVIDATELGDVFANAGVPYDLGMEASTVSGENVGVEKSSDIIQDLTYTAILKDYGVGQDKTIAKPAGYDPSEFDGSCTDYYIDKSRKKPSVDSKKMLDYGKLPNNKYMINWPIYGNDIYLNLVEMDEAARQKALIKAKEQTLRFVYFIQHQLGYKHFGFADDEFPTADQFPLIPYYREGRRVKGLVRFNIRHIAKPFDGEMHLNRTGIAVGDYPIDHHHKKNASAPQYLDFYPVPSFNIPLGAIIPDGYNGLIVAEKGISVSNVVNGTTRLQPAVILIGQAAGTLAAAITSTRPVAVICLLLPTPTPARCRRIRVVSRPKKMPATTVALSPAPLLIRVIRCRATILSTHHCVSHLTRGRGWRRCISTTLPTRSMPITHSRLVAAIGRLEDLAVLLA